jgi:general secretion pathway protein G
VKNKHFGFTLIELLVVIVILGTLAALISGNFFTSLKKGRDAKRKADLGQIQKALEMYYEDKRQYPFSISFGSSLSDSVTGKIYMQKIPNDPKAGNYGYESSADGSYYKLYSCLENDQQILPYVSEPGSFTCSQNCKDAEDNTVSCIWGVSSTNTSP